ncbi:metallophosphoesterase [Candidatus Saccharibacteria bacterium]|nr:metallophosphoesterase [Candidatus Saccharibacteria bacterium]
MSDIHLQAKQTKASAWVEQELAQRIRSHAGPGIVVLNGDIIELWAGQNPDLKAALQAHARLTSAIKNFGEQPGCQVVFVVGNHDGEVGWSSEDQKVIQAELGAKLCFQLELNMNGKVVIFEHGHQLDPDNLFEDQRDPHDHPMGQYVVQKILPMAQKSKTEVLADVDTLADPRRFPIFLFSRIFYRTIVRNSGWLALPFVLALLYRFLTVVGFYFLEQAPPQKVLDFLVLTDIVIILDAVLLIVIGYVILRHFWKLSASLVDERGGSDHNRDPREYTSTRISSKKITGGVFGHTHVAELTPIKDGFYANSGSGTKITKAYQARLGLPKIYIPSLQLSWLEFEMGQKVKVSLFAGNRKLEGLKGFEKLLLKKPIVYTEAKLVKSLEV